MNNKRLIILVSTFLVLLLAYVVQLFFLKDSNESVIKTLDKEDIEEVIEVDKEEESIFGYIEEIDLEEDIRDPFGYPESSKDEFDVREKDFINKINLLVSSMELENIKSQQSTEDSVDVVSDVDVVNVISSDDLVKNEIDSIIEKNSTKYSIDAKLISAIIQQESSFKSTVENINTNSTVSRGLMQLNSETAPWIAKELGLEYKEGMEFDPETNIEMGTFYLSHLKAILDDRDFILTAYSRGPKGAYDYKLNNGTYSSEYSKSIVSLIK
jgi:hypothetical protein